MHSPKPILALALVMSACGGSSATFDTVYEGGQYHLGPVNYDETHFHNACAPATKYSQQVRQAQGDMLAGVWSGLDDIGNFCDTCILVKTAQGKEALLRVVTYGDTTKNSIDVSQNAFDILNSGEFPREMTWQLTKCPETGGVIYEFQTAANEDWTSLWVRNARVPLEKVEVKSVKHASFTKLERAADGTLTDTQGFGRGQFTIKLTGIDGGTYSDTFEWPANGLGGRTLVGEGNFD
ncbi:MAG: hypothetical protein ACAI38_14050 [Myxococcota bacterium]|nr:hypothetical protein [Myxococcota bacterium]